MTQSVLLHEGYVVPLILGIIFAFGGGFRDSSTMVATVVSTRTLSPNAAFVLCSICEFVGAMFLGSAVASTIGGGIFQPQFAASDNEIVVVLSAAIMAAIAWGLISWLRGWPTSSSHAILAGLAGAGWAAWGMRHVQNKLISVVVLILISSPIVGFLLSMLVTSLLRTVGEWCSSKIKPTADGLHVASCMAVALAHGSNDGQLAMGVLLPLLGAQHQTIVPGSMRLMIALALSCGVLFGGRRILKKLGMKFFRIRNVQGLGAQMTAAGTILTCGLTGFPASTTQVIAGSIVGAGASKSLRMVRWAVVQEIMLSWLITFPVVSAMGFVICELIFHGMGYK